MSIHADDEFSLKLALEWELDNVVPDSRLAGSVISRYRRAIRRRVASAVSMVVALAGIGVPLGLTLSAGGGEAVSPRGVQTVFPRGVQTNPPDPPPATVPAVVSPGRKDHKGPSRPGDPRSSLALAADPQPGDREARFTRRAIGLSGLSPAAFVSLVSTGLS